MVIRLFKIMVLLYLPMSGWAQTRSVDPSDLELTVTVEELPETLHRQEMVLVTIHGIYKRHITREKLIQPDLAGLNWMQLGQDHWFESMLDGRPVKNMRRRMAIFPDQTGVIEIGPFHHQLTLLDEDNKWFEHTISSAPISLNVSPELAGSDWWFPVRRLRVADDWSNAPDQLQEGAGVLRIVRISALGASPDMIPPMPELTSPSALIFAHPEKRLVDLTPYGPEAIAFWRWTVTPTNGHSAILEPFSFEYFDTESREMREVSISAQRVAFGDVLGTEAARERPPVVQSRLRPLLMAFIFGVAFVVALCLFLQGRFISISPARRWVAQQQLLRQLRQAQRRKDPVLFRRSAHALDRLYPESTLRQGLLAELDRDLFGKSSKPWDPGNLPKRFRSSLIG